MACLPARILLNAPSGTGKTVALTNLVLDIYKGCFEKIYIFSPTIFIDDNWTVVKKYIDKEMDIKHTDEDPIYFDTFEEKDLIERDRHAGRNNKVYEGEGLQTPI